MHAGRPQMFGSFSGSVKISKCTSQFTIYVSFDNQRQDDH